MWDIFKENIGTGGIVAKYHNSNKIEVLSVYENENGGHFTMTNFSFISICNVSLEEEKNLSRERITDSEEEVAEKRLRAACLLIEADYERQPDVIKFDFL